MSDQKSAARTRADAEFASVQSQGRSREEAVDRRDPDIRDRDEKTARLKAQRLAKEAADRR